MSRPLVRVRKRVPHNPNNTSLAMTLWVIWKKHPAIWGIVSKELVVKIMCALAPHQARNIKSGTGQFKTE